MMHRARLKYRVGKAADEEEAKQRQLRAILNKLTLQNFDKLFEQVKQLNVDNVVTLTGLTSQIFDRAVMEPIFCEMYADLCCRLAAELPDLCVEREKISFRRLLVNMCQEEFERRGREQEVEAGKADGEHGVKPPENEQEEEKRVRARRRMLGNVTFIGELWKKRMLMERIIFLCIKELLGSDDHIPDEDNVEAFCRLMTRTGEMLDNNPKAKEHMDTLFDIIGKLSNNMKLSSRVRFLLLDVIDLRKNKWQPRRKAEGPYKIEEVQRYARNTNIGADTTLLTSPPARGMGRVTFSSAVTSDKASPEESLVDMSKASIEETFGQDKYDN